METMMIKGKVMFVNDDEKKADMHRVSIEVDKAQALQLDTAGIHVTEYEDKKTGGIHLLAKITVFDSTIMYDKENEMKFTDKPLRFGDVVTAKVKPAEYSFRGKTGYSLHLIGLFVNSWARRGGFSEEELAELRG